jgi:outer membrane protein assembly factor BamB
MCRSAPAPADVPDRRTVVAGGQAPNLLPWKENVPAGARFERLGDGRVALTSDKLAAPAWITIPVTAPGLHEVVAEMEDATIGTGLFVADDAGQPVMGVDFVNGTPQNWLAYGLGKPGSPLWGAGLDPDNYAAPCAGKRQWFRLIIGGGLVRFWAGGDGRHWAQGGPPAAQLGPWRSVGIYLQAGEKPRHVKLRSLTVRSLDGILALAPAALHEQAAQAGMAKRNDRDTDLGAWQQRIEESRPGGSDPAAWRFACAIQAIGGNTNPPLLKAIFERLLRDGVEALPTLEAKLDLLRDAAALYDVWTDSQPYAAHWERLGRSLLAEGTSAQFHQFRRAAVTIPLWSQNQRIEAFHWALARDLLLNLYARAKWNDLADWCHTIRFFRRGAEQWGGIPQDQASLEQVLTWVGPEVGIFDAGLTPRGALRSRTRRRALAFPLNRDAYNATAELSGAAEDGLFDDVARMLASVTPPPGEGLVPDFKDPERATSYPAFVRQLVERNPKLRQAMVRHCAPAQRLKIEQTIRGADAAAIEAVTVQFYGTPAAAGAHRWLGDQAMSRGEFEHAGSHYRQAALVADDAEQADLTARLRLASALLGRPAGKPVTVPVAIGDAQVAAADFEAWITQAMQRYQAGTAPATPGRTTPVAALPAAPVEFNLEPWAKFDGDVGLQPQAVPGGAAVADWPARQLGIAVAADVMLVSNRFQVAAFELKSGKRKWTCGLAAEQGPTHAWSMVPMRPVVAGNRVFARLIEKNGRPELACIDLESGKKLWQRAAPGSLVCDPLMVRQRLFALAVDRPEGQFSSQLALVQFDIPSGNLVRRRPLFDLRPEWGPQPRYEATVVNDCIVAVTSGAVFSIDPFEQMLWLRYTPCLPALVEPALAQQYVQAPLVSADRLFLAPPGTRTVECIDPATGRLYWRRVLFDLCRVLDLAGEGLLVQTTGGMMAIEVASGRTLWQQDLPNLLDGWAAGNGLLLCAQRVPQDNLAFFPTLVWLDAATGQVKARSVLWKQRGRQTALGPLVGQGKDLWMFAQVSEAPAPLPPQRDILKLTPGAPAAVARREPPVWTADVAPPLRAAVGMVLPGWALLSAMPDDTNGIRPLWNGAANVLATRTNLASTRLARWVTVPSDGKPRLVVEVGQPAASPMTLEIHAAGKKLAAVPLDAKADAWKTVEVDLSPLAGQTVLVTVVPNAASPGWAYWKRLDLVK